MTASTCLQNALPPLLLRAHPHAMPAAAGATAYGSPATDWGRTFQLVLLASLLLPGFLLI